MMGVYRGFVELAPEVFASLRAVADCALEEAVKAAVREAPPVPSRPRVTVETVDCIVMAVLRPEGFDASSTVLDETRDGIRLRARHRCGALAMAFVDAESIFARRGPERIEGIVAALREIGCYCVPREAAS